MLNIYISENRWFLDIVKLKILLLVYMNELLCYHNITKRIKYLEEISKTETDQEKIKNRSNLILKKKLQLSIIPIVYLKKRISQIRILLGLTNSKQHTFRSILDSLNNLDQRRYKLLKSIYMEQRRIHQMILMKDEQIKWNNLNKINQNQGYYYNIFNDNFSVRQELKKWLNIDGKLTINDLNKIAYNMTHSANEEHKFHSQQRFKAIRRRIQNNNPFLNTKMKQMHLKSKICKYKYQERTEGEKIQFGKKILQKKNNASLFSGKIDWDNTFTQLGVSQLSFLHTNNQGPKFEIALKELINLYLTPLRRIYDDIILCYNELVAMCITYILFNDTKSEDMMLKEKGKKGFVAETFIDKNKNKIIKVEHLRYSQIGKKKPYPEKSYISTIIFISYCIQHFLYTLNNNFVPKVDNLSYDYTNNQQVLNEKGYMIMNLVLKNKNRYQLSHNLEEILLHRIKIEYRPTNNNNIYTQQIKLYEKSPNYVRFIFNILKKLCEILFSYQESCFFIHKDLHAGNVMINFNINPNTFEIDINDFEVKLIDFTTSSVVINNAYNNLSILGYSGIAPFRDIMMSHPYYNKDWNKIDLKFFIITLLLNKLYNDKIKSQYIKYHNIQQILTIIYNIFGITNGYMERYLELIKTKNTMKPICFPNFFLGYRDLILHPNKLNIVFPNMNETYFVPENLLQKLNEIFP